MPVAQINGRYNPWTAGERHTDFRKAPLRSVMMLGSIDAFRLPVKEETNQG
jgi:hypothetical protein